MGKMLVKNGRMAVNGGRMVTTDNAGCCCGSDCCTPLASCLVLTACSSPLESCTNGCTLLPGSIARVNSFSASYSSGNVIRSVSFSGATLKACGNFVGFSGTANLSVTLKGGIFGRTYTVPVCWQLLTTDGNVWGMDVQGGSFDVTDSSGTGDTYTIKTVPFVFDDTFSPILHSDGCGTCEGYPVPTISGSRVMAFYVTHKNGVPNSTLQPSTTATRANWSGSTNFDVFGTLSTDAECNGCPADVYYVWKSCRDADAVQTVWARAEGCAQAPFACQTYPTELSGISGLPKCLSYTGQTVPSTSIPPAGVYVWPGSLCGDATKTPPTYTCCKCLTQSFAGSCCDYISIPMAGTSTLTTCPCHASLSATITHTGSGTAYFSGQPHTVVFEGSYTATRTACGGWNTTSGTGRSIIAGPVINTEYPIAPNSGLEWQVGWTPFNCGTVGDNGACVVTEQTCNRFVTVQTFDNPGLGVGTHTVTVDITITEGACKSTPCSGGAGGLTASGYDGSVASLMRFFQGVR